MLIVLEIPLIAGPVKEAIDRRLLDVDVREIYLMMVVRLIARPVTLSALPVKVLLLIVLVVMNQL